MTDREENRLNGGIKGDATRAERLAAEFRRNLRRRKDRARAVAAAEAEAPQTEDGGRTEPKA